MLIILIVLGLGLLVLGGELFVRGAVRIAERFGISPLLIGLTLVGFGTSTPELLTSLQAAFAGSPGIAIGNVIGSNIANILLILGLTALIAPIAVNPSAFRRDGMALAIASIVCVIAVLSGKIATLAGILLLAGLGLYLYTAFRMERKKLRIADVAQPGAEAERAIGASLPLNTLYAAGGLIITLIGARLLVHGAIDLARTLMVSETVIGLTIVVIGASLPELVTSLIAALRKQGDLAFGNIIGSNIFNILGILGATALIHPLVVPPDLARADIWVMLAATGLLFATTVTKWRISRVEGALMLAAYGAYCSWLLLSS